MGMATFLETQLDTALATYVTATSQGMTGYVTSLAIALTSLYWLFFGLAAMRGDVSEPMSKITKDVVSMLLVAMVIHTAGNYQSYVIEVSQALVSDLTSRMSGGAASSPGALIDAIFADCITPPGESKCLPADTVFGFLAVKHSNGWGIPDMSFFLAQVFMGLSEVVIVVLCLIPILLSKVALAIYLAIGPFFIMLAMFPQSRSYFNSWLSGALGNALTLVIVAGICSIVPLIMKKIIDDAFTAGLSGVEVLNRTLGALIAALGLGLTALKASQMGAQLAGGGVAMDGGNWLGSLGNMYTNLKGRTQGNSSDSNSKDSSSSTNSVNKGATKSYAVGNAAGKVAGLSKRAASNVLGALSKRK
jgi:type IV secretion system protein VirB6